MIPNEQEVDESLRSAFHSAPVPQAPDMQSRVERLIHRRRTHKRALFAIPPMATLTVGAVIWHNWPQTSQPALADRSSAGQQVKVENNVPVPRVLFASPPIDSLGTVTRQQDAYVTALKGLVEE